MPVVTLSECVRCGRGYHERFPGVVHGTVVNLWMCCKSAEYNPTAADKARIADMEREAAHADPRQLTLWGRGQGGLAL